MKIEDEVAIFSTGKMRCANNGIIGLSPEMDVYEGYDGWFYEREVDDYFGEALTKAEQIELADYMIDAWSKFKEQAM